MCQEQKICIQQSASLFSASHADRSGLVSLFLPCCWDVSLDPASFSHLEHFPSKGKTYFKKKHYISILVWWAHALLFLNTLRNESISYSSINTNQIPKVCVMKYLRIQPHWQVESSQHCLSRVFPSRVMVLPSLHVQASLIAPLIPPRSVEPLGRHHPTQLAAGLGSPLSGEAPSWPSSCTNHCEQIHVNR